MELFYFGIYVALTVASINQAVPEKTNSEIETFLAKLIAAVASFLFLWFGYLAGIYYAVTGYAGTFGWFIGWACICTVGLIALFVNKQAYNIIFTLISLFFLYLSGGFAAIS
jgi:hypothetical protein